MDLVIVICFLVLYYLRPQEWSGMFATIHFVQIVMLTGVGTLFFRQGGFRLRELFRTPHDWAVLAFWGWMVIASPTHWVTFKESVNLYVFYIVIVQALRSVPRMKIFIGWWTFIIVTVALLALASKWGFDPLDSLEKTMNSMKGRLILNLSIFNNPNALGHSVVPAIPMLYYYLIWKRPVGLRVLGFGLMLIPLYCIYETVSKGSFLCAAIAFFTTLAFGRPRSVQIGLAVLAVMFGSSALFLLPRMNELSKSKSDEAIQGRVAAFKHGYGLMQRVFRGVGKSNWGQEAFMTDYIRVPVPPKAGDSNDKGHYTLKAIHYNKAPHSSYVCTGAELGKPGLMLFVAVLYCCLRTTMTAKTSTPDEERIRRMLFVLVISYIVSSWMVDFEYRPTFFMFTAAIAALHRHLTGMLENQQEEKEETETEGESLPVWHPQLLPQPAVAGAITHPRMSHPLLPTQSEDHDTQVVGPETEEITVGKEQPKGATGIGWNWNRLGWFDAVAVLALTAMTIRFWAYIMGRM